MTTLSWKDSANKTWGWARASRAIGGRYVLTRASAYWNVDHRIQRGKMRRQLGFAYTIEEAKALAQADNDKQKANAEPRAGHSMGPGEFNGEIGI